VQLQTTSFVYSVDAYVEVTCNAVVQYKKARRNQGKSSHSQMHGQPVLNQCREEALKTNDIFKIPRTTHAPCDGRYACNAAGAISYAILTPICS